MIYETDIAGDFSYTDSLLANGDYLYYVRAVYEEGVSLPSESVIVPVHFPYAPVNLEVESSRDTVFIHWDDSEYASPEEIVRYKIYQSSSLLNNMYISNNREYEISGLQSDEYTYRIKAIYDFGESGYSDTASVLVEYVGNGTEDIEQYTTDLSGNYPNPFNPETTIEFSLKEQSYTQLSIYNLKGQKVKTLVNAQLDKGNHSTTWKGDDDNGSKVGSGVYFYKLQVNGKTIDLRKCLLLK